MKTFSAVNARRLAQILLLCQAGFWLIFGMYDLFLALPLPSERPGGTLVIALAMLVNAVLFFVGYRAVGTNLRVLHVSVLSFVIINTVLAVTDEFGFIDLLVLAIDVITCILILWNLQTLLAKPRPEPGGFDNI